MARRLIRDGVEYTATPKYTSLPADRARASVDYHNALSTYDNKNSDAAFNHLAELHSHVSALAEAFPSPMSEGATWDVQDAYEKHNPSAHTYDVGGAIDHVHNVKAALTQMEKDAKKSGAYDDAASVRFKMAHDSADNYLKRFSPARLSEDKNTGGPRSPIKSALLPVDYLHSLDDEYLKPQGQAAWERETQRTAYKNAKKGQ